MARSFDSAAGGGRAAPQTAQAPDPVGIVLNGVWDWIRARNHQGPLPAPSPESYEEAARWWLTVMCEPEQPGETRQLSAGDDNAVRWDCAYAVRCRQSFLTWLDLSQIQRETVVAGVRGDRVPYRGDCFEVYMRIYDETMRMREDQDAYIASSLRLLRDVAGRMPRLEPRTRTPDAGLSEKPLSDVTGGCLSAPA